MIVSMLATVNGKNEMTGILFVFFFIFMYFQWSPDDTIQILNLISGSNNINTRKSVRNSYGIQ